MQVCKMWLYSARISPTADTEWFGLEGNLKFITFQPPCHGQGRLPLGQAAQGPIQPGFEHARDGEQAQLWGGAAVPWGLLWGEHYECVPYSLDGCSLRMRNQYIEKENWIAQLRTVSVYREQKHEQGMPTYPKISFSCSNISLVFLC